MEKEPGMKKIDTHVPLELWNRYEQWVKGRGNIPSRQLHTRLLELFLALPEHLRLEVLYGKIETLEEVLAPLRDQRHPVPEDVLRWWGMPLTPAWTAAERERALRVVIQELIRRGEPLDQLHAALDAPAPQGRSSNPAAVRLLPEELALLWPEEMKRCAMAVIGRSIPDKERAKLHRIIDTEAAAIALEQADTASQRRRPGTQRSADGPDSDEEL